jgi:hypothetical protein
MILSFYIKIYNIFIVILTYRIVYKDKSLKVIFCANLVLI